MSRRRRQRARAQAGNMLVWQRGDGRTFSFSRQRTPPWHRKARSQLKQHGRSFLLMVALLGVCGLYMASGTLLTPR